MGWRSKLERARRLHRPSLKDWERDGLYLTFPDWVETLEKQPNYQALRLSTTSTSTSIRSTQTPETSLVSTPPSLPVVLDANIVSPEEFAAQYEAKEIPSVIQNIPNGATQPWPAVRNWSFDVLEQDLDLRNRIFKCGEDDDGKSVKVKLKHFLAYLHKNRDDSPLYIFDSAFDDDRRAKKLLADYKVPAYFSDDLFRLVSERRRPPCRWFLVGPERSGTTVHIDPLATSAWNTLIVGKKRWVLFPPHVPKHIVKGRSLIRDDEDDEAIHYFTTILPRIKGQAQRRYQTDPDYRDFCCYEFTQCAGETVFIPSGWWHAVLNLTHTVGVTQNFCSPRNFEKVWCQTRSGRKRLAYKWLLALDEEYPHLAARARALNQRDRFVMKYEAREEARAREKTRKRQLKQESACADDRDTIHRSPCTSKQCVQQQYKVDVSPPSVRDAGVVQGY